VNGRPQDRTFDSPEECFRSSLAVHLMNCHWSTDGWRSHLQWLENVVEQETGFALFDGHHYTSKNLKDIQFYEDKAETAIMVLEANAEVMTSLSSFYTRLLDDTAFPLRQSCRDSILFFLPRFRT